MIDFAVSTGGIFLGMLTAFYLGYRQGVHVERLRGAANTDAAISRRYKKEVR